jgi:hypothetical protein
MKEEVKKEEKRSEAKRSLYRFFMAPISHRAQVIN